MIDSLRISITTGFEPEALGTQCLCLNTYATFPYFISEILALKGLQKVKTGRKMRRIVRE